MELKTQLQNTWDVQNAYSIAFTAPTRILLENECEYEDLQKLQ